MRTQYIRPIRPNESQQFFEWSKSQPEFDAEVPAYSSTATLTAYDKEKVVAYMPVQQPFVLETLAPNPAATDLELATAMKEFVQFLVAQAHIKGVGEIYFLESNEKTSRLAENHIFEKIPFSIYRVKIRDLEARGE